MRKSLRICVVFALGFCLLLAAAATAEESGALRPLKIDDIFEMEGVGRYYGGPYAFSPDGRALAHP